MFIVSCGHTPETSTADTNIEANVDAIEIEGQPQITNSDYDLLKEENGWLRSELIRLNQELADANEAIYTLNRKLDAIFNPEVAGE
jgi:hypothetical protein